MLRPEQSLLARRRRWRNRRVQRKDGHDIGAVVEAVNTPHPGKPLFVCCETHKGHGVSFMEDQVGWHGKAPNKEQYEQAMKELGVSDNG